MTRDDFYADLNGPKYSAWRLTAIEAGVAARREYEEAFVRQNLKTMLANQLLSDPLDWCREKP